MKLTSLLLPCLALIPACSRGEVDFGGGASSDNAFALGPPSVAMTKPMEFFGQVASDETLAGWILGAAGRDTGHIELATLDPAGNFGFHELNSEEPQTLFLLTPVHELAGVLALPGAEKYTAGLFFRLNYKGDLPTLVRRPGYIAFTDPNEVNVTDDRAGDQDGNGLSDGIDALANGSMGTTTSAASNPTSSEPNAGDQPAPTGDLSGNDSQVAPSAQDAPGPSAPVDAPSPGASEPPVVGAGGAGDATPAVLHLQDDASAALVRANVISDFDHDGIIDVLDRDADGDNVLDAEDLEVIPRARAQALFGVRSARVEAKSETDRVHITVIVTQDPLLFEATLSVRPPPAWADHNIVLESLNRDAGLFAAEIPRRGGAPFYGNLVLFLENGRERLPLLAPPYPYSSKKDSDTAIMGSL